MKPSHPPLRALEFATRDGLMLRGMIAGPGEPQMLLLSGVGFPVQTYAPALGPLAERTSIACLNHRGHADSDNPTTAEGWEPFQQDMRDFVETRMRAPVILAGHSFGSLMSLWLAAERPELVAGLLLLDPLFPGERKDPWPPSAVERERSLIEGTYTRRTRWPDRSTAEQFFRGRGVFKDWAEEPFQEFLRIGLVAAGEGGEVELACPLEVERAQFGSRLQHDSWAWVDAVQAPTAILRGAASHVSFAHDYRDLADALPLGAVFTVPGGHTFPMERPQAAGQALLAAYDLVRRSAGGVARGL